MPGKTLAQAKLLADRLNCGERCTCLVGSEYEATRLFELTRELVYEDRCLQQLEFTWKDKEDARS